MGCSESKIDQKVEVLQCRIHEGFLKNVISSRNAFSDAHLAYAISLRKLGTVTTVISDYGESENHLLLSNVENTSKFSLPFDQFDHCFESVHDVSKFLEPTSMCYLSNSADIKRQLEYSNTPVITSNWSSKHLKYKIEGSDDLNSNQSETYAAILSKILFWERKMYEVAKASEQMKMEYQKKVGLLNKQQKIDIGTDEKIPQKTKAVVRRSYGRYIVSKNTLDFTVLEINRLQEKELYPKLLELVDGMAKMWQTMHSHHSNQVQVADKLKMLEVSISTKDRSCQHLKRTQRLVNDLSEWRVRLQNLVDYQRQHIQALNKWIDLVPVETNLRENASSKLQILVREWRELLEKVSDKQVLSVLQTLIEVMKSVQVLQEDEMRMKEKCNDAKGEYKRKSHEFDAWHKHMKGRSRKEGEEQHDKAIEERKEEVESLKRKLKEEEVLYEHACKLAREKSIQSLKKHLPELFRALCEFANDCFEMYLRLRLIGTDASEGKLDVK